MKILEKSVRNNLFYLCFYFLLRHSLDKKYLIFSKHFLLLTHFITEENIDENFLDEQTVDTHQDFSIY
jgi:hypothetical protein